jgi:hypothetical protein
MDDVVGSRIPLLVLVIVGVLVLVPALLLWQAVDGPVSLGRVQRFARRTGLRVGPGNVDLVVRYLATTRRWRSCGLALAYLVIMATALARASVKVDLLALAVGWFAGALVAEWRVSGAAGDPGPRAASLTRRSRRTHLGATARWIGGAVTVYAAGLAALALVAVLLDRAPAADLSAVLPLLLIGGAVRLAQRRALLRPQPVGHPDLIAADDAVRARSLTVLTGSQVALVLLLSPALADPALTILPDTAAVVAGVVVLALAVAAPLLGLWLAFRRSPVRSSVRREDPGVPVG